MPPNDPRKNTYIPKRTFTRPVRGGSIPSRQQATRQASANVVRSQINAIYQHDPVTSGQQPAQEPQTPQDNQEQIARAESFAETSHTSPDSPYDRTHQADRTNLRANQWKRYHSAWQNYYQQYYERYYLGEIYRMRQTLDVHTDPEVPASAHAELSEELSESDAAYHSLRADLLQNVRESAVKVRSSRHFMPFLAGALVVFLLMFLQYNRIIFANVEAYVSPGSINPANIIVDPNISVPISKEPRLIIPKINIDVPVVYDTKPDQVSQLRAMEGGVAWFGIPGANSKPGQMGNTVLSGHSSNDMFDPGNYKFIFARLDQLVKGDTFYLNYKGVRYTYTITKKEVVKPTDVQKLVYPTKKPVVTLITCVPLGTAQNRLLVTAEQVSPDPASAEKAPPVENVSKSLDDAAMPGNSPSLFSRLFGA